ncbi:MAG: hypothetical protein LBE27_05385 [Deltaproteobacteria bacterium]|nr:hypothetical protein [Deltaproteobacteria bacterium]
MKKILFIILLMFLAFITGALLLMVTWYFQDTPLWSLIGPVVFLGIPLVWWLGSLGVKAIKRRRFTKSVVGEEHVVDTKDIAVGPMQEDWERGVMALSGVKGKKGVDLLKDGLWFLFLEPSNNNGESLIESLGAVTDFLDIDTRGLGGRANEGVRWYLTDNKVFVEPKGVLSAEEPRYSATGDNTVSLQELAPALPVGANIGPNVSPNTVTAEPQRSGTDDLSESKNWEEFLKLLGKAGRKIALNGIVLTLPGGILDKERELMNLSVKTRKLLDRLARETDVSPPLYIVITELAAYPGLEEAVSELEGEAPVGVTLDKVEGGSVPLIVTGELTDLFKNHMLDKLELSPDKLAPLMMAPKSALKLERPLSVYLNGLSHESPFSPRPEVRGVFLKAKKSELGDGGGFQGFLTDTLPKGATLAKRLNLSGGKRQKRISMGLLLFYVLALITGFLFYKNVSYHREISSVNQMLERSRGSFSQESDLGLSPFAAANGLGYTLNELEKVRGRTLVRGLGPDLAGEFMDRLKDDYLMSSERAVENIVHSLKEQMMGITDRNTSEYSITLRQILWLLSVFNQKEKGGNFKALGDRFPVLPPDFKGPTAKYWDLAFGRLLMEYLEKDQRAVRGFSPIMELRESLNMAVSMNSGSSMNWLTMWAKNLPDLKPIELWTFWPQFTGSSEVEQYMPKDGMLEVPGYFTTEGREAVMEALNELEAAYSAQRLNVADTSKDYLDSYDWQYVQTWLDFYNTFIQTAKNVMDTQSITDLYVQNRFGGFHPYDWFLEDFSDNLEPFIKEFQDVAFFRNMELDLGVRTWSQTLDKLNTAKTQAPFKRLGSYGEVMNSLRGTFSDVFYRTDFVGLVYNAEPYYRKFMESEAEILSLIHDNPNNAFNLAGVLYSGSNGPAPAGGEAAGAKAPAPPAPAGDDTAVSSAGSAFTSAKAALDSYVSYTYKNLDGTQAEDLFVTLANSILSSLSKILTDTAADTLNNMWESQVYVPVRYMPQDEAVEALYGADGLVQKFASGPAANFVENRGVSGYVARTWDGLTFPLTEDFLIILSMNHNQLAKTEFKESYPVKLTVTGALVDATAREKPEKTTVYMKTSDGMTTLSNYNYPVSQTFNWKPVGGGETGIEISFPSLSLFIHYESEQGFPAFLNDIVYSDFSFTPADFPDHKSQLEAMGITRIRLLAQADGAYPVINFLSLSHTHLPKSIIKGK